MWGQGFELSGNEREEREKEKEREPVYCKIRHAGREVDWGVPRVGCAPGRRLQKHRQTSAERPLVSTRNGKAGPDPS
eukprot:16991-Rhodomonas_salina.3